MLIELRIRDYAVIEELTVGLEAGLNVLSGETGAGKSIIVGALSLLLGERAYSDVVRRGAEKAMVEAVFDVSGMEEVRARMEEAGIEAAEGLLILKREVAREGRNRAWVNDSPTTATLVGTLGGCLVDLHGQHEHQTLLRPEEQRRILDAFAGADEKVSTVRRLHERWTELREEMERRRERRGELESRADFLRFQLSEIEDAEIEPGEDEAIAAEAERLSHAEELAGEATKVYQVLYAREGAVSERLAQARDVLRRLARIDDRLEEDRDDLEEAYHLVSEVGRRVGDYAAEVEHDPRRLEWIRERQDLLFRLKRKYGPELHDVREREERIRSELEELERSELDLEALEGEIEAVEAQVQEAAEALSEIRRAAADRLAAEVQDLLPGLGLEGALFRIDLEPLEESGPEGLERVTFRASLNPGFEPGELRRIASGGELSRVMLALKASLARVDRVPSLVFDEIDAGIGGRVAGQVAEKLREVAAHHQVLVVTHLPQLASRANRHLRVEKRDVEGIASTVITELTGETRIREIARMLGGDPESATSRDHARELLRTG